ncbi:MAG: hypothetical protein BAJALOKI2v1_230030 [Promethearchaeota archaeon]|nr:MAG: hypothetical protein BAJALOKI2v1_230030 [Candidatus Lokiarchaeota archaeon]
MSDSLAILMYLKNQLSDLILLNSIIATELIKITENTAAQRHGEDFLKKSPCIPEHDNLNKIIMEIVKKYKLKQNHIDDLEKHVLKHLEEEEN